MSRSFAAILTLFAIIICAISSLDNPILHKLNKLLTNRSLKAAYSSNLLHEKQIGISIKSPIFDKTGIEDLALVSMVKDEEDIIYENLVWHFCIGFRKFIIIDNNSTDKTRSLIKKFSQQTAGKAVVIIVDDPIVDYIQSGFTTAAMSMASSIWPKVDWVFPVDGDEFWYPNKPLREILSQIPNDKNVILTLQHQHIPTIEADSFNTTPPFYESLNLRLKNLSEGHGKVAVRPVRNLLIAQGNHSARFIEYSKAANYIAGNKIGLDMRHFAIRSVSQVKTKYRNGAKANILAQNMGILGRDTGTHWSAFAVEVKNKGIEQASVDRFNSNVHNKDECIEDPLPMHEAFEFFNESISK